jgi:hypothetical protein
MTPITNTAEVAATATVADVKKMLRDLAYALKLSRRVSAEILAERESKKSDVIRTSEAVSGLIQAAQNPVGVMRLHS